MSTRAKRVTRSMQTQEHLSKQKEKESGIEGKKERRIESMTYFTLFSDECHAKNLGQQFAHFLKSLYYWLPQSCLWSQPISLTLMVISSSWDNLIYYFQRHFETLCHVISATGVNFLRQIFCLPYFHPSPRKARGNIDEFVILASFILSPMKGLGLSLVRHDRTKSKERNKSATYWASRVSSFHQLVHMNSSGCWFVDVSASSLLSTCVRS